MFKENEAMVETDVRPEHPKEEQCSGTRQVRPSSVHINGLTLKVSAKGGVSVYGLWRFPLTLYKNQWLRLLRIANEIYAFIEQHSGDLADPHAAPAEKTW
jgi:hypothetical protein